MIICPVKRGEARRSGLGQVVDDERWGSYCSTIERKQKTSYLVKRFMDACFPISKILQNCMAVSVYRLSKIQSILTCGTNNASTLLSFIERSIILLDPAIDGSGTLVSRKRLRDE